MVVLAQGVDRVVLLTAVLVVQAVELLQRVVLVELGVLGLLVKDLLVVILPLLIFQRVAAVQVQLELTVPQGLVVMAVQDQPLLLLDLL